VPATPNAATTTAVFAPNKPIHPEQSPRPSSSRHTTRHSFGGILGAWTAVDFGSLPATTFAFGGALGVTYGGLRAETTLGFWLPQDQAFEKGSTASATAHFGMTANVTKLCLELWHSGGTTISPCAGVQTARRHASAPSLTDSHPTSAWDWSLVPGLLGTIYLTKALAFRLNLDVLFPFRRPGFGFYEETQRTEVFRPAKAQWRTVGGLEWRFF
jgi:hypothetical protein